MPAKAAKKTDASPGGQPPRDGLVRAVMPGVELVRAAEDQPADTMPRLKGRLVPFNEWTEINSVFEGRFMERVVPGATKKTIAEQRDRMRCLFQHGMDPQVGDKPLGPIDVLRENGNVGSDYEVPLLDTSYNRDLVPGLEAGLFGSSYRFSVMREDFVKKPGVSAHNPEGIPERSILEMGIKEFGPVTFAQYSGSTAGVRSLTDEFLVASMTRDRTQAAKLLRFAGMRAVDTEDIDTLAQMLSLATEYIDEQDEADEQPNIDTMKSVLVTLTGLLSGEAVEDEPDEPEDETNSAGKTGTARSTAEPASPKTQDDAGDRSTSTTGPTPLFPATGSEEEQSWRL